MCMEIVEKCWEGDETVSHTVTKCKETCSKAISMLEAQQYGAGDSLGTMWKAGVTTGMKNITIISHNQCMNPLTTSCCETSKYRLSTRLNTTSLTLWYWIRLLMLLVHSTSE